MSTYKRKLIEVALPLEAINRESAREKSIRHGHPSTLHLWWARRPLASCRAVLFAQLVDDPSSNLEEFPTEELQNIERTRLFSIIEKLVVWESSKDQSLLKLANAEIMKSTGGKPPAILDPFAGGGSIPLEAMRLGLDAYGSDLNPVAVLINKAQLEIPKLWFNHGPVFPQAEAEKLGQWEAMSGVAEDIRKYGNWMRAEALKSLDKFYPSIEMPDGSDGSVIAWIWARTVSCPNPSCGIRMPLVKSWWLSKKKGKEAYIIPMVKVNENAEKVVSFTIGNEAKNGPTKENDGTISRSGGLCFSCQTAVPLTHIRSEAQNGGLKNTLMAIVAEGLRQRAYLPPNDAHSTAAEMAIPNDVPDAQLSTHPQYMGAPRYGLTTQASLFTSRQLTALTCFSDLVSEAHEKIYEDAVKFGLREGVDTPDRFENGGTGALAYADSIAIYLTFVVDRCVDKWSSLCGWDQSREMIRSTFGRQALSMVWDFAETAPFSSSSGNFTGMLDWVIKVVHDLPNGNGHAIQADATTRDYSNVLVSTDPPYYDNVPYADLSDFFYVWMRRSLGKFLPNTLSTVLTPKSDELVADSFRHGGKDAAEVFFENGFTRVFEQLRKDTPPDFPVTVFYAFRQSETVDGSTASTGWQTLLEGMIGTGWEVTATWPIRTELANRMRGFESNALASSIVLALRPRSISAEAVGRRAFISTLKQEMPNALEKLQQGSIAPVDLAQAAIGPGMAIFSKYAQVLEVDGTAMSVRTALALINQVLDEVLSEQEGDFDSDTRFCVKWFSQFGWNESSFGIAESLAKAVNTSLANLERSGVFKASAGKARLLRPDEMTSNWDPEHDKHISIWEVAVRIAYALQSEGVKKAAEWSSLASGRVELDAVKELSYLLFSICEKKSWSEAATLFNGLGTSWMDINHATQDKPLVISKQEALDFNE